MALPGRPRAPGCPAAGDARRASVRRLTASPPLPRLPVDPQTKMVCTLGPTSRDVPMLEALLAAGMVSSAH